MCSPKSHSKLKKWYVRQWDPSPVKGLQSVSWNKNDINIYSAYLCEYPTWTAATNAEFFENIKSNILESGYSLHAY